MIKYVKLEFMQCEKSKVILENSTIYLWIFMLFDASVFGTIDLEMSDV